MAVKEKLRSLSSVMCHVGDVIGPTSSVCKTARYLQVK